MSEGGIGKLESLLVFADGKVALEYPLAVYRPDEFLSGRSVRVIVITERLRIHSWAVFRKLLGIDWWPRGSCLELFSPKP